jgi:hypothetical protein
MRPEGLSRDDLALVIQKLRQEGSDPKASLWEHLSQARETHPILDSALGFVPGVSDLQAVDDWKKGNRLQAILESAPGGHALGLAGAKLAGMIALLRRPASERMIETVLKDHAAGSRAAEGEPFKRGIFGPNNDKYVQFLRQNKWDPNFSDADWKYINEWASGNAPFGGSAKWARAKVRETPDIFGEGTLAFPAIDSVTKRFGLDTSPDLERYSNHFDPFIDRPTSWSQVGGNPVGKPNDFYNKYRIIAGKDELGRVLPMPLSGENEFVVPRGEFEVIGSGQNAQGKDWLNIRRRKSE